MPLFKTHGVTMVISGHDHYYEHGLSNNGIPYVITGGGGAPLYAIAKPSPLFPHKVIYNKVIYHYLVMEIDGKYVHVRAMTTKGVKLEEFYFGKPPIPPPKDAGVDGAVDAATPDQSSLADSSKAADTGTATDKAAAADKAAAGKDSASGQDGKAVTPPVPQDEGCSCRTADASGGEGGLILLLAALLWIRRRRS